MAAYLRTSGGNSCMDFFLWKRTVLFVIHELNLYMQWKLIILQQKRCYALQVAHSSDDGLGLSSLEVCCLNPHQEVAGAMICLRIPS